MMCLRCHVCFTDLVVVSSLGAGFETTVVRLPSFFLVEIIWSIRQGVQGSVLGQLIRKELPRKGVNAPDEGCSRIQCSILYIFIPGSQKGFWPLKGFG